MNLHKKYFCVAGLVLLLGGTNLFAAEKSAVDIISKAYQHIGNMDKYAFDAIVMDDEVKDGVVVKRYRQNVSVKVDRPDKLRVDSKGDTRNRSSYLKDGLFTMIDHGEGYYGQLKTPKTIDGALDLIFEKYGISAPLASLIYSDMDKRMKFRTSKYFGTVDVAGVECDYVAFKSRVSEVHIWITTGDTPQIINYSIIDTTVEGNPRINTSITWNSNPKISESDFIFTAPKGASKISVKAAN
ncbi:hypothetical protein DRJ25_05535 [Candidatus Woesearchaeota archaeon]|nr:MAG: hypothetical protein DRJ25_05535 [Candidatus Woesearchaeota archaeon]